jgi:hypothetical protein
MMRVHALCPAIQHTQPKRLHIALTVVMDTPTPRVPQPKILPHGSLQRRQGDGSNVLMDRSTSTTQLPVSIPLWHTAQPSPQPPPPPRTSRGSFPSKLSTKLSSCVCHHTAYDVSEGMRNQCPRTQPKLLMDQIFSPHPLICNSAHIPRTRQAKHATDGQERDNHHNDRCLTDSVSISLTGEPTADTLATPCSNPP